MDAISSSAQNSNGAGGGTTSPSLLFRGVSPSTATAHAGLGVALAVSAWWLLDDVGTHYRTSLERFDSAPRLSLLLMAVIGLALTLAVLRSLPTAIAAVATFTVGISLGAYKSGWVPGQGVGIDPRQIVLRGSHDPAVLALAGVTLAIVVSKLLANRERD